MSLPDRRRGADMSRSDQLYREASESNARLAEQLQAGRRSRLWTWIAMALLALAVSGQLAYTALRVDDTDRRAADAKTRVGVEAGKRKNEVEKVARATRKTRRQQDVIVRTLIRKQILTVTEKGLRGGPGPRGRSGLAGSDGKPGPAGSDGRDGKDGASGAAGKDGRAGPAGKDGAAGAPGAPGGPAGPPGPEGPAGPDGAPAVFPATLTCTMDPPPSTGTWTCVPAP